MKVKLVLGTINRLNLFSTEQERELYYDRCLKPFISFVFNTPSIAVSCYYSGALLEWLEKNHREFIIMLQELSKENKIELIGSSYYESALPLLTNKERRAQIDLLSTYIRQQFRQKINGVTLYNHIWESALTSSLISSGIKYLLLPQEAILFAGVEYDELFSRFITEDQGKTLQLFPIHSVLCSLLESKSIAPFKKALSQLLFSSNQPSSVTLMFDGARVFDTPNSSENLITLNRLKELYDYVNEYFNLIEFSRFSEIIKLSAPAKKIYINSYQYNLLDSKMFSLDKQCANLILKNKIKDQNLLRTFDQGSFRQFLTRYRESNLIYCKQQWVKLLISQCSDKERKKSATEFLLKSQRADILFYDEEAPGVYHAPSRKEVYLNLIDAEKITREKGEFHQHITLHDYDLDGQEEILFSGNSFNLYLSKERGEAFELDYFPAKWNFLDTMNPYPEIFSLNSDLNVDSGFHFDSPAFSYQHSPNLFVDFFIDKNIDLASNDVYNNIIPFNPNYRLELCDKEKKVVSFSTNLSIDKNGNNFDFSFLKQFTFKKGIELHLEFKNSFDHVLHFKYACGISLSMSQENIKFYKLKNKNFELVDNSGNDITPMDGFIIEDSALNTRIDVDSSKLFSLKSKVIFTPVLVDKKLQNFYQYHLFLPIWNMSIRPHSTVKLDLRLNIAKK